MCLNVNKGLSYVVCDFFFLLNMVKFIHIDLNNQFIPFSSCVIFYHSAAVNIPIMFPCFIGY